MPMDRRGNPWGRRPSPRRPIDGLRGPHFNSMELSAGSHGLPGRGRGSGISAARHWVSHPTGGWNCAAAVVFSRGPRNLPERGRVPGNGRSGDRDADAKEAENLLAPRAGQGLLEVRSTLQWQPHCPRDLLDRARANGPAARVREEDKEDSERGPDPSAQTHEGDRAMRKRTAKKAGIGSAFDDFLKDEGTYEATQGLAIKRVLAWQIEEAMKKQRLTKAEMARRMETSRSQLDRLLDPDSHSVTLETLTRAARAIGRQVKLELV